MGNQVDHIEDNEIFETQLPLVYSESQVDIKQTKTFIIHHLDTVEENLKQHLPHLETKKITHIANKITKISNTGNKVEWSYYYFNYPSTLDFQLCSIQLEKEYLSVNFTQGCAMITVTAKKEIKYTIKKKGFLFCEFDDYQTKIIPREVTPEESNNICNQLKQVLQNNLGSSSRIESKKN